MIPAILLYLLIGLVTWIWKWEDLSKRARKAIASHTNSEVIMTMTQKEMKFIVLPTSLLLWPILLLLIFAEYCAGREL